MADDPEELSLLKSCKTRREREERLATIFQQHRGRLRRMVELRLNHRLSRRVDPSDVLQEAFIDASRRLGEYLESPKVPFFFWLRRITAQKIQDQHRHHLAAKVRDVRKETPLRAEGSEPEASSAMMAKLIVKEGASPSAAAARSERRARIEGVLDKMDARDREILALRYFEGLSCAEAALVLGIQTGAAAKRYERALQRLKAMASGLEGSDPGGA